MNPLSSTLLHEYAHNVFLLIKALDYTKLIGFDYNDLKQYIIDYITLNALVSPFKLKSEYKLMQLNEIISRYNSNVRHNVNNYAWFTVDVYWNKIQKCDNALYITSTNPNAVFI